MRLRSALNVVFAALILFVWAACGGTDTGGGDVLVPLIARVSPDSGPRSGGSSVTLTVSDFGDTAPSNLAVSFGAAAATSVKHVDATTITCVTPAAPAAGSVKVTVSGNGQTFSLENGFRYHADSELTLTSVSPASAATGTTPLVTLGGSFDTSLPAAVSFGSSGATNVTVVNATTITATAPSSANAGAVAVSVTQGSRTASLPNAFTYFAAAARLAFVIQPASASVGAALPAFAVRFEDSAGAPVTQHSGSISLTATHPAGVPASGALSAPVTNGVASFANVSFAHGGKGITLTASAAGVASATSSAFDITATLPSGSGRVFATTGVRVLAFNAEDLIEPRLDVAMTGLQNGEIVEAIDFRPATGALYGLGSTGRLYSIDVSTGAVTQVGSPLTFTGTPAIDFDPTLDILRVSTSTRQSFRVVPDTAVVAATDASLTYAVGDAHAGQNPDIRKNAHARNFVGASTATLYGIDPTFDTLTTLNAGSVSTVGNLGLDASMIRGFDIAGSDTALAVITTLSGVTQFHRVNLALGTATAVASESPVSSILDIAIEPSTIFLATSNGVLLSASSVRPAVIASAMPLTGLQANETVVGMDFSPARNELFAVGSTSRLYKIDPSTAVATGIGGVFATALSGAAFDVDVNPSSGNVEVTSDTGQNLSIDSGTGAVTARAALAGGGLAALAATPNVQGAPPTFLGIDTATDHLTSVNLATGTRTDIGALGADLSAASLDAVPLGTVYGTAKRAGSATTELITVSQTTGTLSSLGVLPTSHSITAMATPPLASSRPLMALYDATASEIQVMDVAGVRSSTVTLSGVTAGDAIQAIDIRPSTGGLYALGHNFSAVGQEGALYTVDTATGIATRVGSRFPMPNAIGSTLSAGTRFGFDFDPAADVARVVSTGRDNFRLDPTTAAVGANTILSPFGTQCVGAAYKGSAGATATTLYAIDGSSSSLVVIGGNPAPPGPSANTGAVASIGSLGVMVTTDTSFDIASSGVAYALFLTGGNWGVYRINLITGAASLKLALPGANVRRGLALFR